MSAISRTTSPTSRRPSWTTGSHAPRRSSSAIIPTWFTSTGGSASRTSAAIWQRFATYYYNHCRSAASASRALLQAQRHGGRLRYARPGARRPGRHSPAALADRYLALGQSWGYIEGDTYKTPEAVIHQLVDVVSKNGNLLMNVGPRPDGTIPEGAAKTLLAVGAWLKVNGDAIYGTRPWRQFGEGPTKFESGQFHDTDNEALHRRRLSLHHEGRCALRHRTRLAERRRGCHPRARLRRRY